jgi:septal ring factor EnvC (AmiA/AmiB activator)
MSENVTSELIFEILKQIQAKLDRQETTLRDIQSAQISIREDLHRLEGGQLRLERMNAETQVHLERIERRLNLVET